MAARDTGRRLTLSALAVGSPTTLVPGQEFTAMPRDPLYLLFYLLVFLIVAFVILRLIAVV